MGGGLIARLRALMAKKWGRLELRSKSRQAFWGGRAISLSAIGASLSAISWRVVAAPTLLAAGVDPLGLQEVLNRSAEGAVWNFSANALVNLGG
jgi:hypothetical protein